MSRSDFRDAVLEAVLAEAAADPEFAKTLLTRLYALVSEKAEGAGEAVEAVEAVDETVEEVAPEPAPEPEPEKVEAEPPPHPVMILKTDGEDALTALLKPQTKHWMRRMLDAHNLDPADEMAGKTAAEIKAYVIEMAKKRVARDQVFSY